MLVEEDSYVSASNHTPSGHMETTYTPLRRSTVKFLMGKLHNTVLDEVIEGERKANDFRVKAEEDQKKAEVDSKKLTEEVLRLNETIKHSSENIDRLMGERNAALERARKIEADMAKVRRDIGDRKFNEIVSPPE